MSLSLTLIPEKGSELKIEEIKAWEDVNFLTECADYLITNGLRKKLMLGKSHPGRAGRKFVETNFDGQPFQFQEYYLLFCKYVIF